MITERESFKTLRDIVIGTLGTFSLLYGILESTDWFGVSWAGLRGLGLVGYYLMVTHALAAGIAYALIMKAIRQRPKGRAYVEVMGREQMLPLEEEAEDARDIFLFGPTLAVIAMKQELFRRKLSEGCRLRFLVPDPNPESPAKLGLATHWHIAPEGFLSEVRSALENFGLLTIQDPTQMVGRVEVHYIDCAPTSSYLIIDGHTQRGLIRVELLPYKTASPDRPHFDLRPNNGHWYEFFRGRCELMWRNSIPLDLDAAS